MDVAKAADSAGWAQRLVQLPLVFRQRSVALHDLFGSIELPKPLPPEAQTLLTAALDREPHLIDAWQSYSYDKRTNAGPYLDGREVGRYDRGRQDVILHPDLAAACADFILRETASMR